MSDERIRALAAAGLNGIEVDHQKHDADTRTHLHALATDLGLVPTGGSDYHGTRKDDHDLGCNLTPAEAADALLGNRWLSTATRT